MGKQQELDEIAKEIVARQVCPELAAGATQLVPGDGNADAEIVFIGEAPGKSEDEQGLPFVGAAGKFLNEMLSSIGLAREDVFITNIVKYRPPGNRDPLPEEKAAFWPYLLRQLMVIKPKLVVTLGRHSMEYFLPSQKISQIHGQPKRIKFSLKSSGSFKQAERQTVDSNVGRQGASAVQGAGEARGQSSIEGAERQGVADDGTAMRLVVAQESAEEQSKAHTDVRRTSTAEADAAIHQKLSQPGGLGPSAGESGAWIVMPLFHPAAALYNGGMRTTLLEDFARIPEVLGLINTKQIN